MTCKNNNTLLTAHNQSYGRVPLRTHTQELSATFDHQLSTDNTTFLSVSENCAHLEIQYKYRFDGGAQCCALPYCHCLSFTFLFLFFFFLFFFFAGYGTLTPKTDLGKLTTIMYALAGIPLLFLYMSTIGHIMGQGFKYTYSKLCRWSNDFTPYKFLNQLSISMMEKWGNFFKNITHSDFCLSVL